MAARGASATLGAERTGEWPRLAERGATPVELKNQVTMAAPPEVVYAALTSPESLVETMPGLKQLTAVGPGKYDAVLELGISAVRGRYAGTMEIRDPNPPRSYRLEMDGKGPGAFVHVALSVAIEPAPPGSLVQYQGEAQVGGTLAGIGQRVMGGVSQMLLSQFFSAVGRAAERQAKA